jgi:CelD/BcsL family acetyltransferase involved in cellulose biosynthesis
MTANNRTPWKFHWLTRWGEIWDEEFVRQWLTWFDEDLCAHVFFHPALAKAWMETYLPLRHMRPWFLVAQSAEHTVFLPLILWRRSWKNGFQRLLIPVGYSDYDYHGPIVVGLETGESYQSFWLAFVDELRSSPCRIGFDRFVLNGVRRASGGTLQGWANGDFCPWIDLRKFKKPEDFLPSLKTSLRGDLRRQERRASEVGELTYLIYTADMEEQAMSELTPFLAAHARRWPAAYKAPHLHENIVRRCMKAGTLHFSVLKIGGKSAAWHLGFVFRNRYYYYLPAQEEKFDRLSPGKLLLLKCIEDAVQKELSVFDFLRGEETYKAGWTDKTEPLWSLQLDEQNFLARVRNTAVDRLIPALKEMLPGRRQRFSDIR